MRLLLAMLFLTSSLFAEHGVQMGEIEIEDVKKEDKEDPYDQSQDNAIKFFTDFAAYIETIKNGQSAKFISANSENIPDGSVRYLTAVYLYCSINRGVCPELLDTVLELDLVNSKVNNKLGCPNMKKLWRSWLDNDMEKRQGFLVKSAFANETAAFKKNQRSRYLKCTETIEKELANSGSATEFFKARYAGENSPEAAIKKSLKILNDIKEKVPNVYSNLGINK